MDTPAPEDFKRQQHETWTTQADGWRRRHAMLARCSAPVSARMVELARVGPGQSVLDVASGSGEPALTAARRVAPGGRVVGTDLVEPMLVNARAHAAEAGLTNVEFLCTDGETIAFEPATFDAATCRWGLMFMPDPVGALRRIHAALKPGGRIAVACWAAPEHNPFVSVALDTLGTFRELPEAPPDAPGMFAFADGARLEHALEAAGFVDVTLETLELTAIEADSPEAYWTILRDLAGAIARLHAEMDASTQRAFESELARRVAAASEGPRIGLRGRTWIAAATRA